MTLTVNGVPQSLPEGATIQSLLTEMKLTPDKVAVELNRRLVRAPNYTTPLKDGDTLEVVTFVGGGA